MDPERWKEIENLYHAALALETTQRPAFLDARCANDPAMRREVESLIAYSAKAGRMLESPPRFDGATEQFPPAIRSAVFAGGEVLAQRFRIVRLLGAGGMGEVYEAEDLVLGESIALKTIRADVADQEQLRGRLRQEVLSAKKISHPSVCRIHDLHISDGVTFLTMELLSGETLGARLRRESPIPLSEAAIIAEQLAGALSAAHRARVIHRDFKPENIILATSHDGGLHAIVTDFGLARSESRPAGYKTLTGTGQILGTLAYMAPEQLLARPVTPASDIYAFGIVLYEMVTGALPFPGRSQLAIAARSLTSRPPSPRQRCPNLPENWEQAILRCLEPEPTNRFPDAWQVWKAIAG